MRRIGVILLLIFEAFWLNAFLPGHTRGVVTLAQGGCCEAKRCDSQPDKSTPDERAKSCAVCFFAARLTTAAPLVIDLPPLARLDEAPAPQPIAVISLPRLGVFDSRGPPVV